MNITFSPLTCLRSLTTNKLGAYRFFVVSKVLADGDSVKVSSVKDIYNQYRSERQFSRDMSQAVELGLCSVHVRRNGESVLVVVSHENAAVIMGASMNSARRRAVASLGTLFSNRWQVVAFVVWQAIYTQNGERLTSQKRQFELTGIQPQMQTRYNKACGVTSKSNYAVSNILANRLDMIREFSNRAAPFAFKNHKTGMVYVAWRLPSTRAVRVHPSDTNNDVSVSLMHTNLSAHGNNTLFLTGDLSFTKAKKRAPREQKDLYLFSHISERENGLWTHLAI